MKNLQFIFTFFLLSQVVTAQSYPPLELVKKTFTDTAFAKELPKYSTNEYKGQPNANNLNEDAILNFKILEELEKSAVVNITLTDSCGKGLDFYIHLKHDSIWKISAFRGLAQTGIIEQVLFMYGNLNESQVDSLLAEDQSGFKSKEDFYQKMFNMRLTIALDDDIIAHFKKNEKAFNQLKKKVMNSPIDEKTYYNKILLDSNTLEDANNLLITGVSFSESCSRCYQFLIGGILDNTVGYLYIPKGVEPPKMSPSPLILLRPIGNGWYLFKTT